MEDNIIKKFYIDIESEYIGKEKGKNIFKDIYNWSLEYGLLGILGIEINTETKETKEFLFKQILNPIKYTNEWFPYITQPNCLVVTWNGRTYDIPIITNKLPNTFYARDLLHLAILNRVNIKGGLGTVIKRLGIKCNTEDKDVPYQEFEKASKIIYHNNHKNDEEYQKCHKILYGRNEFDIRSLPLLEEKLGYLHKNLCDDDKYTYKW